MESISDLFYLDKEIKFLNHGSFGACPKSVIKEYQRWQIELERQPVKFLGRRHGELLLESRKALANYLHCAAAELVFVQNATTAMNVVAHSLQLAEGDEVLSTNLEYGAMDRMWRIVCEGQKAHYVRAEISLPILNEDRFVQNFWKKVNKNTKVIFLSHITSATALLLPIKRLIGKAKENGIVTVVDGAHVPGQIHLDLEKLGADFYTGNCHKWLMGPKGAAFLFASKDKQPLLKPFLISWGRDEFLSNSAFIDEFEYQGTRDLAAFLSIPAAIKFHTQYVNSRFKNKVHSLLGYVKIALEKILQTKPIVGAISENMQMYAHPLPRPIDGKELKSKLYDNFKIEIPIAKQNNVEYIRISLQLYNSKLDVDYFLECLASLVRA